MDLHARLAVLGRREDLGLAGRDGRVALDQLGHHAALRLDAETERGDVEQEDVLDIAPQNAALDRRADGNDLVRVDAAVRLLLGDLLDLVLHGGHARHATDEDHVIDVRRLEAGIRQRLLRRTNGALDEVADQLGQLGAGHAQVEVLRPGGVGRHERQVDLRGLRGAELDLRLLGGLVEALQGELVLRQVDALLLLELRDHPVDDRLVEVVAAEVVVTGGGLHLEDAVSELEDGHVERTATEVEDEHLLLALLLDAVRERGRGGLVDDA